MLPCEANVEGSSELPRIPDRGPNMAAIFGRVAVPLAAYKLTCCYYCEVLAVSVGVLSLKPWVCPAIFYI